MHRICLFKWKQNATIVFVLDTAWNCGCDCSSRSHCDGVRVRASICAIARRGQASTHLCQSISVVRRLSLIWVIAFHNKKKNAIHNLLNWNNGGGRGVDLCVFIVLMVE